MEGLYLICVVLIRVTLLTSIRKILVIRNLANIVDKAFVIVWLFRAKRLLNCNRC